MNQKTSDKKQLLKAIIVSLAAFAVYKCISSLVYIRIEDGIIRVFAGELTLLLCALCAAKIMKRTDTLKWSSKGLGTGILVGMIIFLKSLLVLLSFIATMALGLQQITIPGWEIVLFLASIIMVGVAEELLFRGVLLGSILDYCGESSVSSIRKAIILGGILFGSMHIFNVFIGASLSGSLVQAIDASVTGMIFGAVYVRTGRNLWPCVLLHSLLDLAAFLQGGALQGITNSEVVSSYSPFMLLSTAIMFLVFLFLIRKKKLLPLVKESSAA